MSGNSARRSSGDAYAQCNTAYSTAASSASSANQQPSAMDSPCTAHHTTGTSTCDGSFQTPSNPPCTSTVPGQPPISKSETRSTAFTRQGRRARQPLYRSNAFSDTAQVIVEADSQFVGRMLAGPYDPRALDDDVNASPTPGYDSSAGKRMQRDATDTNAYHAARYPYAMPPQPQGQNGTTTRLPTYNGRNATLNGTYPPVESAAQQPQPPLPYRSGPPTYDGRNAAVYGAYPPSETGSQQPQSPPLYRSSPNQQTYQPLAADPNIVDYYNTSYQAGPSREVPRRGSDQG